MELNLIFMKSIQTKIKNLKVQDLKLNKNVKYYFYDHLYILIFLFISIYIFHKIEISKFSCTFANCQP